MTAGCADVDLRTSVTDEALSSPTVYPVSGSQNPFGLEGEVEAFGPMVAVADFNNDGNPDMAMENNYTAVMVRLGDGAGGFGAEQRIDLGGTVRPSAVIAKDLDADGDIDLVTANDASVSVLLGNGNGTFGPATGYPILPSFFQPAYGSVTAVDLDGDGKLDLAAGMSGGVGVLLGNGDGTFLPRTDLLVSSDAGNVLLLRGDTAAAPCTSGCTPFVVGTTQAEGASLAPGETEGLKISKPRLLGDGDVLYAFLTKSDDAGAIVTPAGWTQLGQFVTTDGDDFTTGLWRRVVTSASTESQSERFTHTDTTAESMSGTIVAVRGANPATPEDAPVAHAAGLNNTHPSNPSVTTTSPLALVLRHEGVTGGAMSKVVASFETTLLQSTEGTNRNSGVSAFLQATPGPTALGQWLNTGGSSGAEYHTLTVAVRPL